VFEKLKKLIEEAQKRSAKSVDTSVFNSPLAKQTEWFPLAGGGSSFQTHRLDSSNLDILVFRATKGAYAFAGVFTLIGFLGLVIPLVLFFNSGMEDWGMLGFAILFGGIFFSAGMFLMYFMTMPRVFDTFYGCYYKGRKKPQHTMDSKGKQHALTHLNEVKAIQVIRERISSKNGHFNSYEINLVLADGSRINVIDHGKHVVVMEDAKTLATALGVPLWDAS